MYHIYYHKQTCLTQNLHSNELTVYNPVKTNCTIFHINLHSSLKYVFEAPAIVFYHVCVHFIDFSNIT